MSKRLQLILALSVPLLAIPLLFILRDWVQEAIVVPLLHLVWFGQLLLSSVPQSLIWAVFLVLVLRVAVSSLLAGRQERSQRPTGWQREHRGRVQVLTKWIRSARGDYHKMRLARHLGELAVEASTLRAQLSPVQISEYLRNGELDAPPKILAYFQAGVEPRRSRPVSLFSSLLRLFRKEEWTSPLDLDLEQVVQFLENQSEIQGDNEH